MESADLVKFTAKHPSTNTGNAKWNSPLRMPWPAEYFEVEPPHGGCSLAFLDGETFSIRSRKFAAPDAE